jgi:hypothetical protein
VAVGNQQAPESMTRQAFEGACQIPDQMMAVNGDRARKIHVMLDIAVRNKRHQQYVFFDFSRRSQAQGVDQQTIRLNRQMRAMVFNGGKRLHHHQVFFLQIAYFGPAQMGV